MFDRFLCKLFTKLFPSFLAKNPKLRAPENEIRRRHFWNAFYDKEEEEEEEEKDREDKEDDDAIVIVILVFQ